MNAGKKISFPRPQFFSVEGYNAKLDKNGEYQIGHKMISSYDAFYEGSDLYESHFPYELLCWTSFFV